MQWMRKIFCRSCKCYQQRLPSRWTLFIGSVFMLCTVFENICFSFFSINWHLFLHKIGLATNCSQNSDKAASFSSVVKTLLRTYETGNYRKPLHNKSRCFNTMKSFLTFKIINTGSLVVSKRLYRSETSSSRQRFCFALYSPPSAVNITS